MSNSHKDQNLKRSIESFFQNAKFEDLNQLFEESKRRFIHQGLEQNNYSLHLTSKSLGYKSISSTILTLFELEDSYLKASHLRDFFEQDYKQNMSFSPSQSTIIDYLSQSKNRTEFNNTSDSIEKAFFENALNKHNGNFTLAADEIDAGRKTVSRKVKKHNISIQEHKSSNIQKPTVELSESALSLQANAIAASSENYPDLKKAYEYIKREVMLSAIQEFDFNIAKASQSLGWTRATFRQNYTTLFQHEKFDTNDISKDQITLQAQLNAESDNIKNTLSLFRRHSASMPQILILFETAKKKIIQAELIDNDGNVSETAKKIGLERSTISHHLNRYSAPTETTRPSSVIKEEKKQPLKREEAPKEITHPPLGTQIKPKSRSMQTKDSPRVTVGSKISSDNSLQKKTEEKPSYTASSDILDFLINNFNYQELSTLKAETTKALIAQTLKKYDYDINASSQRLHIPTTSLTNGLKNYFKVQVKLEAEVLDAHQREQIERVMAHKIQHYSTIRDILPELSTYTDLSKIFSEAQKTSIFKTWKTNNKNVAITANNLGITEDKIIDLLPKVGLD